MTRLQADFKEFLRLLNANRVEYLFIGGYRDLDDLEHLPEPDDEG